MTCSYWCTCYKAIVLQKIIHFMHKSKSDHVLKNSWKPIQVSTENLITPVHRSNGFLSYIEFSKTKVQLPNPYCCYSDSKIGIDLILSLSIGFIVIRTLNDDY